MVKAAYTKKRKEAERTGDEATAARVCHLHPFLCLSWRRSMGTTLGVMFEVHQQVIISSDYNFK